MYNPPIRSISADQGRDIKRFMNTDSSSPLQIPDRPGAARLLGVAYGTAAIAVTMFILGCTIADPDLWGHLRFGLDTLRDGVVTETDLYSYVTEGQRWINHEWLAEVLFALAWTVGGAAGLIVLKMSVGFATIGILGRRLFALKLRPVR